MVQYRALTAGGIDRETSIDVNGKNGGAYRWVCPPQADGKRRPQEKKLSIHAENAQNCRKSGKIFIPNLYHLSS